jgi:hypothetical protein
MFPNEFVTPIDKLGKQGLESANGTSSTPRSRTRRTAERYEFRVRLSPRSTRRRIRTSPRVCQRQGPRARVRPPGGSSDRAYTDTKYCVCDAVPKDYTYTDAWVEKLLRELGTDPASTMAEWKASAGRPAEPTAPVGQSVSDPNS